MSAQNHPIGKLLIEAAKEALAHKRGKTADARVTQRKITARWATVAAPPIYDPAAIRRLRDRLGMSQTVFADLLSVSPAAVRAWESGAREPSGVARRLMQIVERVPEAVVEDLRLAEEDEEH